MDAKGKQVREPRMEANGREGETEEIWSGALMLEHLGEQEDVDAVLRGMDKILENGPKTPDIVGVR